jgi:hypothetical protein
MDELADIKRLYYQTTKATVERDLRRAVDLLRSMATDAERESAAAYMDGLSQMRSEWAAGRRHTRGGPSGRQQKGKPKPTKGR